MSIARFRRAYAVMAVMVVLFGGCTAAERDGSQGDSGIGVPPKAPDPGRIRQRLVRGTCDLPARWTTRQMRGFDPERSPDIITVPRTPSFYAGYSEGGFTGTTHSGVWDYLQEVPLIWYGPGFIEPRGRIGLDRPVTLADLAPTIGELVGFDLPSDRSGGPIPEVLLPEERRNGKPAVIVTVVWDGGGWNVLNRWSDKWPFLNGLMDEGTSVSEATVGSSPSVTPSIHATIGAGTFPDQHGIVDVQMRVNDRITDSWHGDSPKNLKIPTLADLYDQTTGNVARIGMVAYRGWHLGMIGHGSFLRGGDKDIAVMFEEDTSLRTSREWYTLPSYLRSVSGWRRDARVVDASDGARDGRWRGHEDVGNDRRSFHSPAWLLYQSRLIDALLEGEEFGKDDVTDLLFVNYKQLDVIGHEYNMLSEEVADAVHFSDVALERLVDSLNERVGEGRWVLALTADHGQQPNALSVGGWPIGTAELESDLASFFDAKGLIGKLRPTGVWLNRGRLAQAGVTPTEVAWYLAHYAIEDNALEPEEVPDVFDDRLEETVFESVYLSAWTQDVRDCLPG